jgi:hypothetical protein
MLRNQEKFDKLSAAEKDALQTRNACVIDPVDGGVLTAADFGLVGTKGGAESLPYLKEIEAKDAEIAALKAKLAEGEKPERAKPGPKPRHEEKDGE